MKTSVVIPNWNGRKLLEKNLSRVLAIPFDEFVVVDDASTDDSVLFIKTNYPQAKVLANKRNRGFSYTVNRGVEAAGGDIVFLLNSDVLPESDLIKPIVKHFEDPKVFGVSLRERNYWWAKPKIEHGFIGHGSGSPSRVTHTTFWVSGGSGAFRRTMWNRLGGMDTLFSPFYWEDLDLSYRALKRGWKLVWEPRAVVEHRHESTINTRSFSQRYLNYIKGKNQLLFQWKHLDTSYLLTTHFRGVLGRLSKPGYFVVLLLALVKLPVVLVRRMREKKEAVLSNKDVLAEFNVKT